MPTAPMTDKDYTLSLLSDSKFSLHALTMSLTESTNPLLREMLTNILNTTIDNHYRLADIAVNKGWYPQPNLAPLEGLKQAISEAQGFTS